jgi:hypothetical protein
MSQLYHYALDGPEILVKSGILNVVSRLEKTVRILRPVSAIFNPFMQRADVIIGERDWPPDRQGR